MDEKLHNDEMHARPVLVYDDECGFCRRRVDELQKIVGERVEFIPYQTGADRFPRIDREDFRHAVHLMEPQGRVSTAAEAIFRVVAFAGRARFLRLYEHSRLFAWASELGYRIVARHRGIFSRLERAPTASKPQRGDQYVLSRLFFLRGLAVIYLVAFLSLGVQVTGLIGSEGILPVADWLNRVQQHLPWWERIWKVPTLFWLDATDQTLRWSCWIGAGGALLAIFRILPGPLFLALWALYLSLTVAGQVFLSFQWDNLLLEAGFLAIFLAPWRFRPRIESEPAPSFGVLWLLRWLLLRLMFCSGAVKLIHDHPIERSWRGLTALNYHYETQPLPTWVAWYAHQLPDWFQQTSLVLLFVIEIAVPLLIFGPRALRHTAAFLLILLQVLILLTGNYTFFNWLSIVLCLVLLDDRFLLRFVRQRTKDRLQQRAPSPHRAWPRRAAVATFVASIVLLSGIEMAFRLWPRNRFDVLPDWMRTARRAHAPFRSINSYGLFTHMTTSRPEIIIEGSNDGHDWQAYEFRYKPGDPKTAPAFVAPHQPRLDWQMWFVALSSYERQYWFQRLMHSLLRGSPDVLGLFRVNPFPDAPPKFVRAVVYDYRFTTLEHKDVQGTWWRRVEHGAYSPVLRRRE